jgi:hypothetical protein
VFEFSTQKGKLPNQLQNEIEDKFKIITIIETTKLLKMPKGEN